MFSSWFVHIERTEPAAVSDGAGVDALVREIEELVADAQGKTLDEALDAQLQRPWLDAIFAKLHIIDHLH